MDLTAFEKHFCVREYRGSEHTPHTLAHGLHWVKDGWDSTDAERRLLRAYLIWLKAETSRNEDSHNKDSKGVYGHEDGKLALWWAFTNLY